MHQDFGALDELASLPTELGDFRSLFQGPVTADVEVNVEVSDELELIPTFAVALSGCDLRCAFCITGAQSWNANEGEPLVLEEFAARAESALASATPSGDNAFKIELASRVVARAIALAAAGTPERMPALPGSPFATVFGAPAHG